MGASDGSVLSLTKIVDHGPSATRFNLVIVAEGYTASQLNTFESDAASFVAKLFSISPFDESAVQGGINVYRLNVASTDSGMDDPSVCGGTGASPATYFDATACYLGVNRLIGIDFDLVATTLNAWLPEWDCALVVVNHASIHGGSGSHRIAVASKYAPWGVDWRLTALHELGHSAGGLADEYHYYIRCGVDTDRDHHPATEPAEVNVTIDGNRATIKWGSLIAATTAMPTTTNPDCSKCPPAPSASLDGIVGAFEGAHYYHCDAFRPQSKCIMKFQLDGSFCAVCREQIRTVIAASVSTVPNDITLSSPTIQFADVPAGSTVTRAALFDVNVCCPITLEVTAGPTVTSGPSGTVFGTPLGVTCLSPSPPIVRQAEVVLSYTGTAAGDTATGTVTVHCAVTNQTFDIPITANVVAPITAASVLVLDQSASMDSPSGIVGMSRLDVLKAAAPVFVELTGNGDGVGLVRFDEDARVGVSIQVAGPPGTGVGRAAALAGIEAHAANPLGRTAIGDGLALASDLLAASTFDRKSIVVFTDGHETAARFIRDVTGLITDRVFAIGLGTAEQLQPAALDRLVNNTGGYLLMTGATGTSDLMRSQKYFAQVAAGATQSEIVVDPDGALTPGYMHRIPFSLTEADLGFDAILLSPAPSAFKFALEAPDGTVTTPTSIPPSTTYRAGERIHFYRLAPPNCHNVGANHRGTWFALLALDEGALANDVSCAEDDGVDQERMSVHGVPFTVCVHARSDLRMRAAVVRPSLEPGTTLTLRVTLSEYEHPVHRRAVVQARVERPDGTTMIALDEREPGIFSRGIVAALPGMYRFHVRARGETLQGSPFTREQLLTAPVWFGGDACRPREQPFPKNNHARDQANDAIE